MCIRDSQQVGTIGVVDIADYNYLAKYGENMYDLVNGGARQASTAKVTQGCICLLYTSYHRHGTGRRRWRWNRDRTGNTGGSGRSAGILYLSLIHISMCIRDSLLKERAVKLYEAKETECPEPEQFRELERVVLLKVIDRKWMDHIDDMDQLRQGIGLSLIHIEMCIRDSTYVAPFVNAEECEYLVIEDWFPNGRPELEKGGIIESPVQPIPRMQKMLEERSGTPIAGQVWVKLDLSLIHI